MDNALIHALSHEELVAWLRSHTYLDPLWDASFKILIADAAHPERLVHFLNALLRLDGPEEILTADLHIQEHPSPFGYEKGIAFDIHCVNQRGEPIVVEMQRKGTNLFKDRMLYYAATAIRKALASGTKSYRLPKVFILSIMNFSFDEAAPRYHRTVQLVEREDHTLFYDKLTFVYIELPHFRLGENELVTYEDKWLYALQHMGELVDLPAGLSHPIFQDLFESARICKFDISTLEQVATHMRDEASYNDDIAYTEAKAEARGKAEGVAIGKAEGKVEGKMEIARQMRSAGEPLDKINLYTGLTIAQIEALE